MLLFIVEGANRFSPGSKTAALLPPGGGHQNPGPLRSPLNPSTHRLGGHTPFDARPHARFDAT